MLRLETNNDYAVSVKQIAYFSHEAGKVSRFLPKRTVQYWSRLPTEVAEAPPLQVFRTQLCKATAVLL